MKERNNKKKRRLRIVPLILGGYAGFLGLGLMTIGIAGIQEGIGIARFLLGTGMACLGVYGIWDGARDLVKPEKRPEKPAAIQFILTDITGNKSSNVTMERLQEQLKGLTENENPGNFHIQILPSLAVQEKGTLNQIFCIFKDVIILTAFFEEEEEGYQLYQNGLNLDRALTWFEGVLSGSPDFSGWAKVEKTLQSDDIDDIDDTDDIDNTDENADADGIESESEGKESRIWACSEKTAVYPEGAEAYGSWLLSQKKETKRFWRQRLIIFGESWHDEHPFFSARDLELTVEGIHEKTYQKAVLEWGFDTLNIFHGQNEEVMVVWRTYTSGNEPCFMARQGTVTQVKFWMNRYLNEGTLKDMSGWNDITAQVIKGETLYKKLE